MPFCRSIYVTKVMKLLAFIFEQPSYDSESTMSGVVLLSYFLTLKFMLILSQTWARNYNAYLKLR